MAEQQSPEEIRSEMKRRFDAANAEAKAKRQVRYDAQDARQLRENNLKSEANRPTSENGANNPSGG